MIPSDLSFFHAPDSVAVVGASDDPWDYGGRPIRYLREFGYQGTVLPVSAHSRSVQGFVAYPSLAALPCIPDVAVITVAGPAVADAIGRCAEVGVPGCIVFASGLGEIDDRADSELQRHMLAAAETGMRLIGPNAQGIANFANGTVLTPWGLSDEEPAADGPVAIISQSGAMCSMIYGAVRRRGIGVRYAHGIGGSLDVTVGELAAAVLDDPGVRLVLLYLEDVPDPSTLQCAAAIASARQVPIVALMGGRSAAGKQAAQSHTGALANENRVVDAFFERIGVWRANNTNELLATTELYLSARAPSGRRLAVVSNSGATCVLAADAAADRGIPLAQLTAETQAELATVLPLSAMKSNPIDMMGVPMADKGLLAKVLSPLAEDTGTDACFLGLPVAGPAYNVSRFVRDASEFSRSGGKPLVVAAPQPDVVDQFRRAGVVAFHEESGAIAAMAQFLQHHQRMAAAKHRAPMSPGRARSAMTRTLNETDSLDLLERLGIPVIARVLCADAEAAGRAFTEFGGAPVVVKGCTRDATHKSELGLVRLGLCTRVAVEEAAAELLELLEKYAFDVDGVLVAPMVPGVREVMVGAHVDPAFGPVVVVGAGGKYVEVLPDVQLLLPPFTADEALRAIWQLACAPLLKGVRGEPAADVEAWAEIAVRLGNAMIDPGCPIVSLDANPVMLGARGGLVADAVAVLEATQPLAERRPALSPQGLQRRRPSRGLPAR